MADGGGVPFEARRGRGAISNRAGRFEPGSYDSIDDGWDIEEQIAPRRTTVIDDHAKTILTRNASPDIPFDRSINPYRGCEHGCVYCFARPSHAFLGLSPGLDFETRLFAKPQAAALLEKALRNPRYRPAPIAIGTNTDPYQPVERERRIMRGILEVLLKFRHPVSIVTKSALVTRDADILSDMADLGLVRVALSVTTLDHRLSRAMEPRAVVPTRRLQAIRALAGARVPVAVMAAPMIPKLNDHELERILTAAAQAGAVAAGYTVLRMPLEIRDLFREWLEEHYPHRAERVMRHVRDLHGGRDYDPQWGRRMRGQGPWAAMIAGRFRGAVARLGLNEPREPLRTDLFRVPPRAGDQLSFFDDVG